MSHQPVKKYRVGYISATIWENLGPGDRKFYTVDIQRTFKNGDDLQNTPTLNAADLENARYLLRQAHDWINQQ